MPYIDISWNTLLWIEKFYLVDSSYPNKSGYLALYRDKSTISKSIKAPCREVKKSTSIILILNYALPLSVLLECWKISGGSFLKYQIIICKKAKNDCHMHGLAQFIRESHFADKELDRCDNNENYLSLLEETRRRHRNTSGEEIEPDSVDMNQLRYHYRWFVQ
jgi:hypothetical protein